MLGKDVYKRAFKKILKPGWKITEFEFFREILEENLPGYHTYRYRVMIENKKEGRKEAYFVDFEVSPSNEVRIISVERIGSWG